MSRLGEIDQVRFFVVLLPSRMSVNILLPASESECNMRITYGYAGDQVLAGR